MESTQDQRHLLGPPPCGGRWCEGASCTTARHLGEERKEVCPLSCRCRTGGALEASGCYFMLSFLFFEAPLQPFHACPNHSKERSSITFEHSCQMHIVFLRILFVLAASFLAAISLANSWGMFVQHKLGPCDLISSSRPYNVNNNP